MKNVGIPQSPTRWSGHAFLAVDARWVLHDVTLDGNSFRESHSVDKRAGLGQLSYGIAVRRDRLSVVLSRQHGTREFDRQRSAPVYGSVVIRYEM